MMMNTPYFVLAATELTRMVTQELMLDLIVEDKKLRDNRTVKDHGY